MVAGGGICYNLKDGVLPTPAGFENLGELFLFLLKK